MLWMASIAKYYAEVDAVRLCPSALYKKGKPGTSTSAWVWSNEMRPGTREPKWTGSYALNGWFYSGDWPDGAGLYPNVKNAFRLDSEVRYTSESPIFCDSMWVDAWPQEKDRPASDLANGNAGQNAGMARITLARHKYSTGNTALPSSRFKNSILPGAINLVFFDGHAEMASRLQHTRSTDRAPAAPLQDRGGVLCVPEPRILLRRPVPAAQDCHVPEPRVRPLRLRGCREGPRDPRA